MIKKLEAFKNTISHTLEPHYLRWKYLPWKIHPVSNVIRKNTTGKRKRKSCYYHWFSLGISLDKFLLWFPPSVSSEFNLLGNFTGSILYLKQFQWSHSCVHIKEEFTTACVNYGSYWTCLIVRYDKQDLFPSSFSLQSNVNTSLYITAFWWKLLYPIIKINAVCCQSIIDTLIKANIRWEEKI